MRERAVRETERRLAGDVLAEALGGRLGDEDLRGRLQPFGIDGRVAVLLFELEEPPMTIRRSGRGDRRARPRRGQRRRGGRCSARSSIRGTAIRSSSPVRAGTRWRSRAEMSGRPRAGQHRWLAATRVPRSPLRARGDGDGERQGTRRRLPPGPRRLHAALSLQDDDALRTYSRTCSARSRRARGVRPELLRSLEAFIERNGQWERAARDLYCHRHTLRYRIRQNRGADRARPRAGAGPNRTLARPSRARAGEMR